jgi:hypothetical protein
MSWTGSAWRGGWGEGVGGVLVVWVMSGGLSSLLVLVVGRNVCGVCVCKGCMCMCRVSVGGGYGVGGVCLCAWCMGGGSFACMTLVYVRFKYNMRVCRLVAGRNELYTSTNRKIDMRKNWLTRLERQYVHTL